MATASDAFERETDSSLSAFTEHLLGIKRCFWYLGAGTALDLQEFTDS